jgi:hypothetical protein
VPPLQTGLPLATVVVHALPQPPQLSTSLAAFTHWLPQVRSVAGQVNPHAYGPPPTGEHVAVA